MRIAFVDKNGVDIPVLDWFVTCYDLIVSLCFTIPRVLAGLLEGSCCFGLQLF